MDTALKAVAKLHLKINYRRRGICPCSLCSYVRKFYQFGVRGRSELWVEKSQFNEAVKKSEGRCSICNEITKSLVLDHDHENKSFRGLLCGSCNIGLGCFKDREDFLLRASKYLENSKEASLGLIHEEIPVPENYLSDDYFNPDVIVSKRIYGFLLGQKEQ